MYLRRNCDPSRKSRKWSLIHARLSRIAQYRRSPLYRMRNYVCVSFCRVVVVPVVIGTHTKYTIWYSFIQQFISLIDNVGLLSGHMCVEYNKFFTHAILSWEKRWAVCLLSLEESQQHDVKLRTKLYALSSCKESRGKELLYRFIITSKRSDKLSIPQRQK